MLHHFPACIRERCCFDLEPCEEGSFGGREREGGGGGGVADWELFQKVNIYRKCWPVRTPVSYFGEKNRGLMKKKKMFERHGRSLLRLSRLTVLHDGKTNDKKQVPLLKMENIHLQEMIYSEWLSDLTLAK